MKRPNILLIVTHDSGRHFGCYGAGVETPNIDRLGREGARFDNAFCTSPQCSPARAAMLTGRYPHRAGLLGLTHRGFRLTPSVPRLPAMMAEAGYHSVLFGVHHEEPDPHLMGYRRWEVDPAKKRDVRSITPLVESFLASAPPQPFFACVGFRETHRPFPMGWPSDDPRSVAVPPYLPDEPPVREDIAELNGMVRGVDEGVGRIDAALHQAELADNTLLIFTTDHGIAFPLAKGTLRDPGIGVGLVMRGPGFASGRRIGEMVSTMDVTPTVLTTAGVQPPEDLDGMDLSALTADKPQGWRDHLFAEQTWHAAYDPMRAVRTGRFKYIRSFADRPMLFPPNVDDGPSKTLLVSRGLNRRLKPAEQLFDLDADPNEQDNLADDPRHAATLVELRSRVESWMRQTNDPLLGPLPLPLPAGAIATPAGAMSPDQFDAPDGWR